MTWTPFHFLIVAISGWMDREQQQAAYRQIDAATVVKALSPIGDAPANEAQARPLTSIRDKDWIPRLVPPPVAGTTQFLRFVHTAA
jgi:hypothetical protein